MFGMNHNNNNLIINKEELYSLLIVTILKQGLRWVWIKLLICWGLILEINFRMFFFSLLNYF